MRATNGTGASAWSNVATAQTTGTVPAAPTGLTATAVSSTQINLAWTDPGTTETAFEIERSPDGTTFTPLATVAANVTTYAHTGLTAATTQHYRVRATNGTGASAWSNVATAQTSGTVPAAPTGLTATAVSSTQINLAWTDPATNETGFEIERSPDGTTFTPLATVAANATTYVNTGLTAATTYHYRVRATNGTGPSAWSNVATAQTTGTARCADRADGDGRLELADQSRVDRHRDERDRLRDRAVAKRDDELYASRDGRPERQDVFGHRPAAEHQVLLSSAGHQRRRSIGVVQRGVSENAVISSGSLPRRAVMKPYAIRRKALTILIFVAVALIRSQPAAQIPTYDVTDLNTIGGGRSAALGVNNAGEVVGYSEGADGRQRAFLYSAGSMLDLGTFGGEQSYAYRINDLGIVVGRAEDEEGVYRPFVGLRGSPLMDLTSLDKVLHGPFGVATAINNLGHVVGYRQIAHGHKAARNRIFVYRQFAVTDLGALGGEDGVPTAINDAGQIAGYFGTEPHADYADHRAFLLTNGNLITLGTLGGRLTTALDLNNLGHVVGRAHTSRGDARAFLYTGGDLTDLGTLAGGRQSAAHAINDSGQVVGASESAAGPQRAFLYSGGVLRDLNTLISTSSGWHLSEARDINNSGVIVGIGLRNGEQRGFLLKPR